VAKDNYSYKKHQKELARKKKAEAKRQKKLKKKTIGDAPEPEQTPDNQAAVE
jgi:hypothetical protein